MVAVIAFLIDLFKAIPILDKWLDSIKAGLAERRKKEIDREEEEAKKTGRIE